MNNAENSESLQENCDSVHQKEHVAHCRQYAFASGLIKTSDIANDGHLSILHLPFTLNPTYVNPDLVLLAQSIQIKLNAIYFRVSRDYDFLLSTLNSSRKTDGFIQKLCLILEEVRNQEQHLAEPKQRRLMQRMCVFRNDLMVDTSRHCQLSQVEFNTISVAFIGQASTVNMLHRHNSTNLLNCCNQDKVLPTQCPATAIASEIAHLLQSAPPSTNAPEKCRLSDKSDNDKKLQNCLFNILFIIVDGETNIGDQIKFEMQLKNSISCLTVYRATLTEVYEFGRKSDNCFFYKDLNIDMVYYRAGYSPDHYSTEKEWRARRLIETCPNCVKCPDVGMQLAGMKKIQAELCKRSVLEKYWDNAAFDTDDNGRELSISKILSTFTEMLTLDNNNDVLRALTAVKSTMTGDGYMLKPLREGGSGDNIDSSSTILSILENNAENASNFVLQKVIKPPKNRNILVLPNEKPKTEWTVSELGIFGFLAADRDDNILSNIECGYLLRTKPHTVKKGGVASGNSVLDSISLIR